MRDSKRETYINHNSLQGLQNTAFSRNLTQSLKGYDIDPAHSLGISLLRQGTQTSSYILFLRTEPSRWLIVRLKTRMSLASPSLPSILPSGGLPFE